LLDGKVDVTPKEDPLKQWLEETLGKLSKKSLTTKAIHCTLGRWGALMSFCDDGRIEIDNNAAERSLRAVVLGRKDYFLPDRMPGVSALQLSIV
jgi:transposase